MTKPLSKPLTHLADWPWVTCPSCDYGYIARVEEPKRCPHCGYRYAPPKKRRERANGN